MEKIISTVKQRDQILHDLYKERNFIVFWNGQKYFDSLVQEIHNDWINHGGMWGNDLMVEQTCWEFDNGYL